MSVKRLALNSTSYKYFMIAFSTCWNSQKHSDGLAMVEEILELALDNDFNVAREKMSALTNIYGLSEKDFLKYMNEAINKNKYKEIKELIEILAKYDYRIITGSNPDIQLTALLAEISNLRKK